MQKYLAELNAKYGDPSRGAEYELVILEEATLEYDVGWVFFYEARLYLQTGHWIEKMYGNRPLIVDKRDGSIHSIDVRRTLETNIENHRKYGSPYEPRVESTRVAHRESISTRQNTIPTRVEPMTVTFISRSANKGPHQDQPIRVAGASLSHARAAMIMAHGRGTSAEDILGFARAHPHNDLAYFAPQAAGHSLWPRRFLEPLASNEPYVSSALMAIGDIVAHVNAASIPPERIMLLGFSQGACLVLEFAARNPQRYGGVAVLSGALVENGDQPRDYIGSLAGTPIFLGCSDVDSHIPKARVERSAELLRAMGGDVTMKLYANMGHGINEDELDHIRRMMTEIV